MVTGTIVHNEDNRSENEDVAMGRWEDRSRTEHELKAQ